MRTAGIEGIVQAAFVVDTNGHVLPGSLKIIKSTHALFSKAVMVEFPRKGLWSIGFLTNKAQGEPQAKTTEEVWTVFVPTTPNPTTGFLVMLPERDIVPLDMSVGEAMKMIISGGAVVPPWPPVPAPVVAPPVSSPAELPTVR